MREEEDLKISITDGSGKRELTKREVVKMVNDLRQENAKLKSDQLVRVDSSGNRVVIPVQEIFR